jgi:glutamine amidotransferase
MHNGLIGGFAQLKRDLVLAIDPSLYTEIKGGTDSETLFYLALTFGLEDDPPDAVAHAIGLVEALGRERGVQYPFQGTIATSNGDSLWAFRYSSEGKSRSLFYSRDIHTVRALYPDKKILEDVSEDARLVVSEPVGDLPGAWHEMPEATYGTVGRGQEELFPFKVKPPPNPVSVPA